MGIDLQSIIGEQTTYEKKGLLERNKSKHWLKSVSAYANGEGGTLIFGITDDDRIVGMTDAKGDSEFISEAGKAKFSNGVFILDSDSFAVFNCSEFAIIIRLKFKALYGI